MDKAVYTEVEGQKLKLTNLHKKLYPDADISKAEVISYFLEVAKFMVPHIVGRPLTLIRWPDGIGGKSFYTKNKPSWTPDWIPSSILPWDEDNEYIIPKNAAHLIWIANLAALEIHTMNSTLSNLNNPNQFIVDLDPPEDWSFDQVKEMADQVKSHLEEHGYKPLGKLSGGKGIHLMVPLIPKWDYDTVMVGIKEMMRSFIQGHKNSTLHVHKEKRKGKMLLDIYRNHPGNTTVAPFSLRGKPGGPVSMPLPWKEIMECDSPRKYTLTRAIDYLKKNGNPWAGFEKNAVPIHTQVKKKEVNRNLDTYKKKRDFDKTNEPSSAITMSDASVNGNFVVQLHDATNLHFDLRLGQDGVLKSWAIPKGLPIRPGVKRLAIQTEDHPAKYIDFEGVIPKGEYGGGEMWVFDKGTFEWNKQSKKSLKFTLQGKYLKAAYNMYNIKNAEWIVELEKTSTPDIFKHGIQPMLAGVTKGLPKNKNDYLYEIKWDGIRVIVYKDGDDVRILSRSGRDISDKFPEFAALKFCKVQHAIFDAELVCLDERGRPIFADIISRMHRVGKVQAAVKTKPVYMYIFDCLYIDGMKMTTLPFVKRRALMIPILKFGNLVRESDLFEDGQQIYEAAKAMQLEGIMAKKKDGIYDPGGRSDTWKKIKYRQAMDCCIIGYTKGQGDRASLFGALHLATIEDKKLTYMGKVGTGFDHTKMRNILDQLLTLAEISKPIPDTVEEESKSTWIEPKYYCEIQYASLTNNGTLREPVFLKMWLKD